jgi:dipeptidyl aminopeptidase/acylaminoacyl peptidase
LFEGSFEDHYHDPGRPFEVMNAAGKAIVQITPDGTGLYLHAQGASPEGDQPFVSILSLANADVSPTILAVKSVRVWQSAPPFFESPLAVLDAADQPTILLRRESPEASPNYYLKNVAKNSLQQVTRFPNPYGDTSLPKKQVLKYKRTDGVELSANLYLPPGYKTGDGPLPTLMEAYPTEYKTKAAAGQMRGSPYEFPSLYWGSPVPFATQGYAVLENDDSDCGRGTGGAERYLCGTVGGEREGCDRRRSTAGRGGSKSSGRDGTLLWRVHDGEFTRAQRSVQGGDRAQRGLQPHADAVRISE